MSNGYGGFWNLERDDAGGGLTGSVVDVARLLAMLDVRTNNPVLTPRPSAARSRMPRSRAATDSIRLSCSTLPPAAFTA